jgi:hypothetical protein
MILKRDETRNGAGSGSRPMAGFGVRGVELSSSVNRDLVNFLVIIKF